MKKHYVLLLIFASGFILIVLRNPINSTKKEFINSQTKNQRENIVLTSTRYRYDKEFQKTLNEYQGFQSLYQKDLSTAIPGLEYTLIGNKICDQMVPQGICIAGSYMLITAYDYAKNSLKTTNIDAGRDANCSVIYVLSNDNPANRELLTTIELPDVNHVGGITFDGKYVWIAKSTSKQCSGIDFSIIEHAVKSKMQSYKLHEYTFDADCGVTASFLTYEDGRLWVGTFQNLLKGKGSLKSYDIMEDDKGVTLRLKEVIYIPNYANGITFTELNGRKCMAIVTSVGRFGDSKIHLYEVSNENENNSYHYFGAYRFPPMAEEVTSDGENLYFLFESSATNYSTTSFNKCYYPVDRICAVDAKELFFWVYGNDKHKEKEQNQVYAYNLLRDQAYINKKKTLSPILAEDGVL